MVEEEMRFKNDLSACWDLIRSSATARRRSMIDIARVSEILRPQCLLYLGKTGHAKSRCVSDVGR